MEYCNALTASKEQRWSRRKIAEIIQLHTGSRSTQLIAHSNITHHRSPSLLLLPTTPQSPSSAPPHPSSRPPPPRPPSISTQHHSARPTGPRPPAAQPPNSPSVATYAPTPAPPAPPAQSLGSECRTSPRNACRNSPPRRPPPAYTGT